MRSFGYPDRKRMRWWGDLHPRNPAKQVAEAKGYTAMLGHYHLRGEEMDETIALFSARRTATLVRM